MVILGECMPKRAANQGFTLIELSVVLVIIGLIAGGILVGRDLVNAAAVRGQISQIDKYNSAVNTFYGKYGALPGDAPATVANQFGFAPRGPYAGEGDGNGIIEGVLFPGAGQNNGLAQGTGETTLFWVDLSTSRLLDSALNTASANGAVPINSATGITQTTTPNLDSYFPAGKIGQGNYIYIYSSLGVNYYGIAAITNLAWGWETEVNSTNRGLTVQQAYNIDKKVDDSLPRYGRVQAAYANYGVISPLPSGAIDSTTTCYNTTNNAYSISSLANYGAGGNCALSFRFQ